MELSSTNNSGDATKTAGSNETRVNQNQENMSSSSRPTTTTTPGTSFSGVLQNFVSSSSTIPTNTTTNESVLPSESTFSSINFSKPPMSPPITPTNSSVPAVTEPPGIKDSFDGFLTPPPPASTLLIRRTRTSSTGPSTYVVQSLPSYAASSSKSQKQPGPDFIEGGFDGSPHSPHDAEGMHKKGGKPRMGSKDGMSVSYGKSRGGRSKSNIDPLTGKRRYRRKNKFTFTSHKKSNLQSGIIDQSDRDFIQADVPTPLLSITWRPDDDLRLLVNVLQTRDFKQVHLGVRFSKRYTLDEIKKRWNILLYNNAVAKTSAIAVLELHPKVTTKIFANALLNDEELKLLQQVHSTSNVTEKTFEDLLLSHPIVFYKCRTAKFLHRRWLDLKSMHLLDDQNVKDYFESDLESFSDFENTITDDDIRNLHIDPCFMQEFLQNERRTKKKIRILEEEIARWQELSDLVWEGQIAKAPQFDDTTYAIIRGRNVRFGMAAKEITLGRRTKGNWVDANLSEEGSDIKVSRRQATIKMRTLGDFVLLNQGRHPMYVDGQAIFPGETTSLQDQSVITVSNLNFVFIVNDKLLSDLRKKIIEEEANAEHVEVESVEKVDSDSDSDISHHSTPRSSPTKSSAPPVTVPTVAATTTTSSSFALVPPSKSYFMESYEGPADSSRLTTTSPTDAYFQSSSSWNAPTPQTTPQSSSSSSACTSPPSKRTYTIKKKKVGKE